MNDTNASSSGPRAGDAEGPAIPRGGERQETEEDRVRLFHLVQEQYLQQQAFYWQRYAAFAVLHGGLFVLATSDSLTKSWPVEWLGAVLSVIWVLVQWASLHYVDRMKPQYHELREQMGIRYEGHWLFNRRWLSSTDLALYGTLFVLLIWILVASGLVT